MRVQNEGTGKSSWWVLNPEAKPGKSQRRRATTMDSKDLAKKRGRVKRKVEQLRAMEGGLAYAGSQDLGDPYAAGEYRTRASSNASSIGAGRLSPISSQFSEFEESINELSPPLNWPTTANAQSQPLHDPSFHEISNNFASMLVDDFHRDIGTGGPGVQDSMVTSSNVLQAGQHIQQQVSPSRFGPDQTYLQVGGAYDPQTMRQYSPQQVSPNQQAAVARGVKCANGYVANAMRHQQRRPFVPQSLTELLELPDGYEESMDENHTMSNPAPNPSPVQPNMMATHGRVNVPMTSAPSQPLAAGSGNVLGGLSNNMTPHQRNVLTTSLLRQFLTDAPDRQLPLSSNGVNNFHRQDGGLQMTGGGTAMQFGVNPPQMQQQQQVSRPGGGADLEFLNDVVPADFSDCDVDQMIHHELNMDGNLDFNFDGSSSGGGSASTAAQLSHAATNLQT